MVEPIISGSVYRLSPLRRPPVQPALFRSGDDQGDARGDARSGRDGSGQAEAAGQAGRAAWTERAGLPDRAGQAGQEQGMGGEDRAEVERLKAKDAEIRASGRARAAGAGGRAGAVVYTCRTGPDGNRYAVTSAADVRLAVVPDNPEATLRNAEAVHQAVLSAPGDHSAGDWQVAVRAQAEAEQARRELHRTGKAPGQGHGRYAAAQAEAEGQQEPAVQAQAVLPDTSPTAVPDDDAAVFGESPILSSLV